jgi:hypothetical protein
MVRVESNARRGSTPVTSVRAAAVAGFAALALLVPACSGSGSEGPPPTVPSSASPTTDASPTAAGLAFSMRDPEGDYIIHYPAAWNEHQDLAGISLIVPQHVGLAGFHYKASEGRDLQQVANQAPAVEKTQVSKFRLVDTSPAVIDGVKAVQFTYTGQNKSNVDLKAFATWAVRGKKTYRFSFTASADSYAQLYPTAQAIMHSIHFTGAG